MTESDRERQLPAHKQDKAEIVCCDKVIGKEGNDNNWEFQSVKIKNKIILGPTPAGMFRINNLYHFGIISQEI